MRPDSSVRLKGLDMNIEIPPFPPSAEYFEAAFNENAAFDFGEESPLGGSRHRIGIKRIALGRIAIQSGEVLATDPSYLAYPSDERPFQERVPPGDYRGDSIGVHSIK